ncbi:MAG: efflux RND transporter periplasmic adaptor subunit, partial [Pseudomonadota bacterium]
AWQDTVVVRGRTEALRKVSVRAETPGAVAETPTEIGETVTQGQLLCRLRLDARNATLQEARAGLEKARLDYNAVAKLAKDGFRSETAVAAARSSLDLARARLEQAELSLDQTEITAPFDGVFERRDVEVGDYMRVGDPCGTVIQRSPFLVVGAVSEREIAKVRTGDPGKARLSTGQEIDGVVRYVATASDPATRTFRVELEIPNAEGALKDGVTADFTVFAADRLAHLAPRSALTLDQEGRLSVRTVDGAGVVHEAAVRLLGEDDGGVWIDGLDGEERLIVRGQEFVSEGQKVNVVLANALGGSAGPQTPAGANRVMDPDQMAPENGAAQ